MYTWFFLCIFVVVPIITQVNASYDYNNNDTLVREHKLRAATLADECKCQSARNDYTYRYPEVVWQLNQDSVYHYLHANSTYTWNCTLCNPIYNPIYPSNSICQCDAALQRYTDDYNITTNQYQDYIQNTNTSGQIWHCELCLLSYNVTCLAARIAYYQAHIAEVGPIDETFYFITYGMPRGHTWPSQLCSGATVFAENKTCTIVNRLYSLYHPNVTLGLQLQHYTKYHLMLGWRWAYNSCDLGQEPVPSNCRCVAAKVVYWSNYPDVFSLDIDPSYHYENYAKAESWRQYNCEVCNSTAYPNTVLSFDGSKCNCAAASALYSSSYIIDGGVDPFIDFISSQSTSGHAWHCEICPGVFTQQNSPSTPTHLVDSSTCIGARKAYLTRYPDVQANSIEPVWHYENIGYYANYIWDQTACTTANNPKYLTDYACSNCTAVQQNYITRYPTTKYFLDPFQHWRLFYLKMVSVRQQYTYPCELYCDLNVLRNTTTTTTTTTTSTTTTSTSIATTSTTGVIAGSGTTGDSTSGGATTSSTSTTIQTPAGFATTTDRANSSDDGGGALSTTAVLAIVVPIAAVLSVGIGMLFIHQQRRQAVQALIKAEEGERRNYKIDFMSLSIDWLIGSGSFGHVYRGEYRGADVAIKKLKKQNMGNQQLEDFAKEAMVMVGLRHPNIVLFMGVCLERPELCIVTEYMPRGNLYDVLHDASIKLPFNVVRNMALHVVKGLQFIHSAGMIHRDLKSPNLLVDANWTIKIADFGLSCAKSQVTDDAQISLLWTAPEILMREKSCYSEKSDVYSLGIILWELMSRQTPFNEYTTAAIPPVIVLGKRPPVNSDWNPTMKVLMAQCWSQQPSHRPTVRDVRVTLDSINIQDISLSEGGINTPHSSFHSTSEMGSELSVFPPRGSITVVFVDVDKSADLWEANPTTMLVSLRLLNETTKKLLIDHGGYEAKTEGDASMLTFSDVFNAVNFCLATQLALLNVEWPADLLKLPAAKEEKIDNEYIYRGLRVRMGLHSGIPHCEQDQITFRTEYFGPVVNTAARIISHATGGQIVASAEVHKHIANNLSKLGSGSGSCVVEQIGTLSVKGSDPILLYHLWPKALKAREVQLDLTNINNAGVTNSRSVQYSISSSASQSQASNSNDDDSNSSDGNKYAWNLRHNEKWIINYDDLELDVVIGTGSFGDVYAGKWKEQKVAVKQFMKQKVTDEVLLEMRTESGILSAIEHPNIIRFLGMCIKIPHLCIVTELLERGSLATILLGNEELSWPQRKSFATDIARGLEYLHNNNIIHRDVKSPNMLVAGDWTIKIGDFGFSRVKSESHTMTQCGTVAWTAPEIFLGERYSEKADVYSYSVILWELVFRRKPWQGLNSMKVCHSVENGQRLPVTNPPPGTPDFMLKLMKSCWLQEHESRPSFSEVLKFLEQQR